MKKGFLLVISGPSGVGKGTVCDALISKRNDVRYSVSATTRKKRPNEIDGENYYFLSLDEFNKRVEDGDFLEYAQVHNNFYGTPKSFVLDEIAKGEIVILEIDVQGALKIKESYPGAVFVFLLPPDMVELRRRIVGRDTEDEDTVNLRMRNAETEIGFIDEYDYAVTNNWVEDTVSKIESIIEAERLRVVKNRRV